MSSRLCFVKLFSHFFNIMLTLYHYPNFAITALNKKYFNKIKKNENFWIGLLRKILTCPEKTSKSRNYADKLLVLN